MYHAGIRLWHNHRTTFREHKKYYCNQLRKPFSMSVVNFNTHMREYRALLHHLPPLSSKRDTKSFDANWDAVKITKEEIQAAIYDALPEDYKTHINYQCKADWQDMDENKVLNAMIAYKHYDNTQKFKRSQREKKRKHKESLKKVITRKKKTW